jgi:hypothetical protein
VSGRASIPASSSVVRKRMTKKPLAGYPAPQDLQSGRVGIFMSARMVAALVLPHRPPISAGLPRSFTVASFCSPEAAGNGPATTHRAARQQAVVLKKRRRFMVVGFQHQGATSIESIASRDSTSGRKQWAGECG